MFNRRQLLCILLLTSPHWSKQVKICESLTDEEVYAIFQTERDSVPEYEVVPVLHSLNNKDVTNPEVHFKSFGKDVTLYLWPAEGMLFGQHTPVYTVESDTSSPRGLRYTKYDKYGIYWAYQDESNNAAIVVRQGTNDSYKFDGTFGKHFVMRSLPEKIIDEIISNNKSYYQSELFPSVANGNESYAQASHHLVIKMGDSSYKFGNATDHSLMYIPLTTHQQQNVNVSTKQKRSLDTVYPEILTVVEYDTFKSFKSDISETLVYLMAFWNGVDLRYRALTNPKVRLNIATIIIALDRNATPYLNDYHTSDNKISTESMQAMGKYFYAEDRFERESYDIAIVVTKLAVCEWVKVSENSSCAPLRGISKFGSACAWSDRDKAVEAVALIHDQGFNGVATAAHELGHILGVPHDGSPSPDYIGGPGATRCSWTDGYLMSSERFDGNAFKWSNCSLECFKFFLKQPVARCLYNSPKFDMSLPRILPGTLLSLDAQCYEAGALEACYHDQRACVLLYCTMPDREDQCFAMAPAAEGSKCGDKKICIQGQCIEERQWRDFDIGAPQ